MPNGTLVRGSRRSSRPAREVAGRLQQRSTPQQFGRFTTCPLRGRWPLHTRPREAPNLTLQLDSLWGRLQAGQNPKLGSALFQGGRSVAFVESPDLLGNSGCFHHSCFPASHEASTGYEKPRERGCRTRQSSAGRGADDLGGESRQASDCRRPPIPPIYPGRHPD